ncbi:hypothetical protein FB468_3238 [Leucobacter komagatae]|uniref:Lipoprotein n=1 Tax=Leucobacter komagatae TaxID=55969 RepID=A0A542XY03_9MICO|nr:hypothetical protein [Leucobacter komagatae]TQL40715.1 hypothetical protein FB468_3238 [Leucobacter komagatae]
MRGRYIAGACLAATLLLTGCTAQGVEEQLCASADQAWQTYAAEMESSGLTREEAGVIRDAFIAEWNELSGLDRPGGPKVDILRNISRSFLAAWIAENEHVRRDHVTSLQNGFDILGKQCAAAGYEPSLAVGEVRVGPPA